MREDKQVILNKLCETLRCTYNAGTGNALKEIRYVIDGDYEYAVPVFENGAGEPSRSFPHGYYAVCINGDSGTAMITDVVNHFVREVW